MELVRNPDGTISIDGRAKLVSDFLEITALDELVVKVDVTMRNGEAYHECYLVGEEFEEIHHYLFDYVDDVLYILIHNFNATYYQDVDFDSIEHLELLLVSRYV